MSESEVKPQVVSEGDVKMVGPGHDDSHYISVPIKQFFQVQNVGDIGVCYMEPGDETCVYKVKNTGSVPGKFFYYMSSPRGGAQRFD